MSTLPNPSEATGGDDEANLFFVNQPETDLGPGTGYQPTSHASSGTGYQPTVHAGSGTSYQPVGTGSGYHPSSSTNPIFGDDDQDRPPSRWHGGADFGLLVLRLVLGGVLIAYGLWYLFGSFNGPGIHDFGLYLSQHGYTHQVALAWLTGGTELVAGGLLVLGLFTSLASAGALAVMSQAILVTWHTGFFPPNGYQLPLIIAAGLFTLLWAGPGRVAMDKPFPWYRHPVGNAWLFLIIAAGASTAVWFLLRTSTALPTV